MTINQLEKLGSKATAIISILTLVGMTIGFLDIRHAKSSEFEAFKRTYTEVAVDRYEEKIEELEQDIIRIKSMPEPNVSNQDRVRLIQLSKRREKYLRKLERLQ